jgi:hypothetical protein
MVEGEDEQAVVLEHPMALAPGFRELLEVPGRILVRAVFDDLLALEGDLGLKGGIVVFQDMVQPDIKPV